MGNAEGGTMKLEVLELLKYFKGRLEKDSKEPISFLTKRDRADVLDSVEKLLENHFEPAEINYDNAVDAYYKALEEYNNALKQERGDGKKRKEPRKPNLSDHLIWNEVHEQGHKLWTDLMRAAIVAIDPNAKGHSALLDYLDAATKFEDLLYGLEEFYRDHTLHSLWVYLIGIKLMGEKGGLEPMAKNLNWYVYNEVRKGEYSEPVAAWAHLEKLCLNEEVQKNKDAIWCVMALCHDLGYSLAKLDKLNEKVQAVLEYYDVSDFRHVGYTLDLEHQYLVTQCLDLMAMEVYITPGDDCPEEPKNDADKKAHRRVLARIKKVKDNRPHKPEQCLERNTLRKLFLGDDENNDAAQQKDDASKAVDDLARGVYDNVLIKCFRDDASYWRLCKALERKEHGVLSAYLLYKTMGLFADTSVRSPAEGWGLEDDEVVDNIIRGDILFAIAQHEFAFAHIDQMSSLAEILILCDELEEFTRLGRQLQSRKYHDTTADAWVCVELGPETDTEEEPRTYGCGIMAKITMTYESQHQTREEFVEFCCRKAKRLCKLFSLVPDRRERTANKEKPYRIREIETVFNYYNEPRFKKRESDDERDPPDKTIVFTMRDKQKRAVQVTVQPSGRPLKLECRDDDIYVANGKATGSRLVEWLWGNKVLDLDPKLLLKAKKRAPCRTDTS